MNSILLGAILSSLIASFLFFLIKHSINVRKRNKLYFATIWKKSSALSPEEILDIRPFNKYYYKRHEDELLIEKLKDKKMF